MITRSTRSLQTRLRRGECSGHRAATVFRGCVLVALKTVQNFGTIVVCGGGCYGGYYLRQLARAIAANAITVAQIIVVDRDPNCRVASLIAAIAVDDASGMREHAWRLQRSDAEQIDAVAIDEYCGLRVRVVTSEWEPFFAQWFAEQLAAPELATQNAVVPSPLMPHLLADWVQSRLAVHRPNATVRRVPVISAPATPWQRAGSDDAHYASFATWMCPINCIEPPRCPETKGPRDWSMPVSVRAAVQASEARTEAIDVVALFRTTHRAFGVGMFDVNDALDADADLRRTAGQPAVRVLVASVSHCHGALAELLSEQ
jgi:hypothetical protein